MFPTCTGRDSLISRLFVCLSPRVGSGSEERDELFLRTAAEAFGHVRHDRFAGIVDLDDEALVAGEGLALGAALAVVWRWWLESPPLGSGLAVVSPW